MKGEGWEPGDPIPEMLPEWASCFAYGDYTLLRAALPTKDGRKMGNAVNVGGTTSLNPEPTFLIVTDAGNTLKLTVSEMEFYFHPPKYVMKDLLPSHREGLKQCQE